MQNKKVQKGISLLEMLVVVTIFAILGIIVSSSLILTIQGTRKSEALIRTRENLNYSINVIERNLRNATSISDCTNSNNLQILYIDQAGNQSSFSCVNMGLSDPYVASGSSRLTSSQVKVTDCSFTCEQPSLSNPPVIIFNVSVQDTALTGVEGSTITSQSEIYLRNQ